MTQRLDILEQQRLALQERLDSAKTPAERNRLGQFATPTSLAREIVRHGVSLLPRRESIRFLDPAIGTGAFYTALRACCPNGRIAEAVGYEIDPHYGLPATDLWRDSGLNLILEDFTRRQHEPRFNLIICNPPYVRHHHLKNGDKTRLAQRTAHASGMNLSGLAGLYCHFMGLAHAWMAEGAVAGWLIPSEFMDVNYGAAVKRYLLNKVTLLHIHRFDPDEVQFADALVSSAVVWIRNTPPPPPESHSVKFTLGGSLAEPRVMRVVSASDLRDEAKWTRFPASETRVQSAAPVLGDFFKIKRGIATGSNEFFILSEAEAHRRKLPPQFLRPILPSPRYVREDVIESDADGIPLLEKRHFLLDVRLTEIEIERRHPALWMYLNEGRARGIHEGYICRNRPLWYAQEQRPAAPIVCTYLGRAGTRRNGAAGRPFRFIRNRSYATVANVYLAMYPTRALQRLMDGDPALIDRIWQALNAIDLAAMVDEGRVYGGGLYKLEPKELANVPVPQMAELVPGAADFAAGVQHDLFAAVEG